MHDFERNQEKIEGSRSLARRDRRCLATKLSFGFIAKKPASHQTEEIYLHWQIRKEAGKGFPVHEQIYGLTSVNPTKIFLNLTQYTLCAN